MSRAAALWARVEPHVGTRRGWLVVGAAALVAHSLVSLVLPVQEGADYVTYTRVYAEMWSWRSVIPWALLWRMPVAPALIGAPLDLAGPWGGRVAEAVAYAACVVVWFRIAGRVGPRCAVATAAVLLVHPSYQMLFHTYSSDAVTGLVFTLLALALVRAWEAPTAGRWAALGATLALVGLTRPAHQALLPLVLVPLLLTRVPVRRRLGLTATVAAVAIVPLLVWTGLNGVRYDDRALSRGGGAWLPFYRAYLTDRVVQMDNGPASRELARLVERELLDEEPYRSFGITVQRFFDEPTTRYHEDLVGLTDRVYGWDDRNAILRRVALEGIRRHPGTFASGYARSFVHQLAQGDAVYPARTAAAEAEARRASAGGAPTAPAADAATIPAARFSYWLSRPDNAFTEVWTSATEHHIASDDPALVARIEALDRRVGELRLPPTHGGSRTAMLWVNRISNRLFPSPLLFLLVGVAAWAWRRPVGMTVPALLVLASLAVLAATLASVPPLPRFVSPFIPAFVVFGLAALLAPRRRDAGSA